jgi:hypothetical protein
MNKIYKVIWSHVKQCYVVTSELAKAHGRTSTRGRTSRLAVAALTAFILTAGVTSVGLAADKDIVEKGAQPIAYDISTANDGTNIAVGKNAKVFIGGGTQESMLSFGEKVYQGTFSMHIHDNDHAKKNLPEGIAVGTNSYARTGSIEIGAHTLAENKIAIGDTTADKLQQFGVASTTLGTNSYTGGGFATTLGSYNVQTNQYEAAGIFDASNATKNAFATVIGTFNSNESLKSYDSTSGVANMISGTANKVTNSNGAIVMGAGNSVKNSIGSFDTSSYSNLFGSAADMQKALMDGVAKSAGGATLVIGGANNAEKTQNSQIMGVGNSMKSTTSNKIEYNYLDGFNSSITDASHVKVLGQSVTINKGADSNTVIGDNRTVAENQTNNVIIGNADEKNPITTEKKETVILGYNANATVDGGVAIGSGSIANVGAGQKGYYVKHDQRSEEGEGYPFQNNEKYKPQSAWISRAGAVSVGDTTNEDQSKWITRQITGVAAGTNDTDAVNVAQLKNSQTRFYSIYDPGDDWLGIFPQIPNWEKYKNADNQGAQGYWSMAAGFGTSTGGIASTVIGSLSKIDNKWTDGGPNGTQGATAVSVGTLNFNLSDQVTDEEVHSDDPRVIFQSKENSGVANSIVGQGNLTKNSNGALIYGAGNIVTDSYRRVVANGDNDLESLTNQDMESLLSNPEKAIKTLGKIVDISGGKVMVMGGGNVVDKAYDSQVMGVGNTVVGDAIKFDYKESPEVSNLPEGTWDEQVIKEASRDADVWTQYMGSIRKQGTLLNLVDGYYSTLRNGQNDYLIGTANEVTGDPSKNKSNIVFGDYHKLNNGNNNIIIGSADGAVVEKAKGYYEDYESGITTSQEITGQKQHAENLEDAVMIGHNADVQKNGGVALGAGSVASVDKGAVGYDLANGDHSKDTTGVWKSKAAAVSVGQIVKNEQGQLDAEKTITRQITGVAAGSEDTDAVNVAQLKAISNTVDASKTKYYSVQNMPFKAAQLGTYATYTNEANDGAKEMGALAAGYMTYAGGIASTVTGSLSGVINQKAAPGSGDFRGATALSYGTFNINNNSDQSGAYSGVANSIVGQANMTTDSNAALIYGAGNVISNSYRDIRDIDIGAITGNLKDPEALGKALQAAVPTSGGQVMAFGGGNVVDNAYMTQVIGVGNTVKGNQKKNDDGTWSSDGNTEFDATSSQLNYVDGFYTTLINGKNDYLIGAHNTVTGDSVENNHSNIVIGDNHTLENQSNNIILGSADRALPTTASKVTILGHNANATVEGGVALGYGSIANREAGKAGLDLSLVNKDGKVGDFSKDTNPVWTSNAAAVSIGNIVKDSEGKLTADAITRQITGVAAGSEDYDAVNVAQLRQVVAKMNYYTVKESDKVTVPPSMKDLTNKDNDGAKKDYGMAAGYMTNTNGVASTVSGSFSGITTATATTDAEKENVKYQGAAALSYGTFNYNRNTDASQKSAGAVNSLVGQTNLVENSNAAQIYGSANSITNSYRHINMDEINSILNDGNPETSTPDKVMEKLQKAIVDEKTGGMVTVVGSANTADKAYMTQIQGVSNTVRGSVVIDENNEKNATTHNYVGGFFNTLENGKSNYVIGTKNTITSSSDSTKNASNIVIGDNHKLTNGSHNVIIGSEDVETAKETPAARHGLRMMAAEETETSNSPDNVVRIGHNAKATYDYGAALGAGSVASTDAGVYGYDPLTGIASTSEDKTWKSTWAAASIGDSTHTRQLTNVAAGWADTDAVNVAQLRAVASKVGSVMNLVAGDGISIVNKDGVYTISANIKGGSTPTDDVKVDPEKPGEGGNTSGSTTDTPVTPVDPGNTGNTENPGNTDNPSNGSGLIITAETKPTHFGADSGEATAVKPGETLAIKGDTTNIMTTASDHGITVSLKKDIAVDSITAGDTKMTSDGLTITGGPSITKSGIDAGGKKVTHVADGEIAADSKDAVNGSQLYRVQKNVESIENNVTNLAGDVTNLNGRVSDLDNRVNKVGAGAAALAALHPLDFNPDDKWNFAVGYGNYRNANSVAVGAFYQPNENTMFNVATNFGNGENMINAGVSFKIGKGNSYAGISKAQLVAENQQLKENDALQDQKIQKQDQEIQELKKALEELKSRIK